MAGMSIYKFLGSKQVREAIRQHKGSAIVASIACCDFGILLPGNRVLTSSVLFHGAAGSASARLARPATFEVGANPDAGDVRRGVLAVIREKVREDVVAANVLLSKAGLPEIIEADVVGALEDEWPVDP